MLSKVISHNSTESLKISRRKESDEFVISLKERQFPGTLKQDNRKYLLPLVLMISSKGSLFSSQSYVCGESI